MSQTGRSTRSLSIFHALTFLMYSVGIQNTELLAFPELKRRFPLRRSLVIFNKTQYRQVKPTTGHNTSFDYKDTMFEVSRKNFEIFKLTFVNWSAFSYISLIAVFSAPCINPDLHSKRVHCSSTMVVNYLAFLLFSPWKELSWYCYADLVWQTTHLKLQFSFEHLSKIQIHAKWPLDLIINASRVLSYTSVSGTLLSKRPMLFFFWLFVWAFWCEGRGPIRLPLWPGVDNCPCYQHWRSVLLWNGLAWDPFGTHPTSGQNNQSQIIPMKGPQWSNTQVSDCACLKFTNRTLYTGVKKLECWHRSFPRTVTAPDRNFLSHALCLSRLVPMVQDLHFF